MRRLAQERRDRAAAADGDDEAARAARRERIAVLQQQLNYTVYYPRAEKYLSLFPKRSLDDDSNRNNAIVRAKRDTIMRAIHEAVRRGELPQADVVGTPSSTAMVAPARTAHRNPPPRPPGAVTAVETVSVPADDDDDDDSPATDRFVIDRVGARTQRAQPSTDASAAAASLTRTRPKRSSAKRAGSRAIEGHA